MIARARCDQSRRTINRSLEPSGEVGTATPWRSSGNVRFPVPLLQPRVSPQSAAARGTRGASPGFRRVSKVLLSSMRPSPGVGIFKGDDRPANTSRTQSASAESAGAEQSLRRIVSRRLGPDDSAWSGSAESTVVSEVCDTSAIPTRRNLARGVGAFSPKVLIALKKGWWS